MEGIVPEIVKICFLGVSWRLMGENIAQMSELIALAISVLACGWNPETGIRSHIRPKRQIF